MFFRPLLSIFYIKYYQKPQNCNIFFIFFRGMIGTSRLVCFKLILRLVEYTLFSLTYIIEFERVLLCNCLRFVSIEYNNVLLLVILKHIKDFDEKLMFYA